MVYEPARYAIGVCRQAVAAVASRCCFARSLQGLLPCPRQQALLPARAAAKVAHARRQRSAQAAGAYSRRYEAVLPGSLHTRQRAPHSGTVWRAGSGSTW